MTFRTRKRRTFFILSLAAFFLAVVMIPASVFAAAPEPKQAVEDFFKTIQSMNFPVQDPAAQAQLAAKADSYLDLEALGKKALEIHWDEAGAENQKTFTALFTRLIENVAYPKSRRFIGDYKITYPETKPLADGFEVRSVIKQQEEALDVHVIYYLHQVNGQWKVYDIVLDEVSITEDLKYQFDKIIADSKFSGLLDKMRERIAEAEKENGSSK